MTDLLSADYCELMYVVTRSVLLQTKQLAATLQNKLDEVTAQMGQWDQRIKDSEEVRNKTTGSLEEMVS